ncbi:DUF4174 domain-containing protein [Paraglaciecola sp. 20A4]|uniref:DUF4174 domain-containing protein n=1 Tax=Paraglaciecola sp. 20A4 TaxID=2687288 RepID=UPI00140D4056|nr:DUF4174 domain-containing protein [Paraglaciecola sp. 20A4]
MIRAEDKLADFQWQNRVLLSQVASKAVLAKWQAYAAYQQVDLTARKLVVFVQVDKAVYRLAPQQDQLTSVHLRQDILTLLNRHADTVLLIGLDGGIKQYYPLNDFSLEQVFADVDLMPMRKAEIGNNPNMKTN